MKLYLQLVLLVLATFTFDAEAKTKPAASPEIQYRGPKALFDSYAKLEHNFDPLIADLYSDAALIRNKRTYPDGQVRTLEPPAVKYKALIRAAMPAAKAVEDYNTYSDLNFSAEGSNVRVIATRYSVRKKYSSKMSLLVGPQSDGSWIILEELSESQP